MVTWPSPLIIQIFVSDKLHCVLVTNGVLIMTFRLTREMYCSLREWCYWDDPTIKGPWTLCWFPNCDDALVSISTEMFIYFKRLQSFLFPLLIQLCKVKVNEVAHIATHTLAFPWTVFWSTELSKANQRILINNSNNHPH